MTVEMEKAPRGGALCAKAQSDSVRASIYFTTLQILRAHPARSKAYAMELVSSF